MELDLARLLGALESSSLPLLARLEDPELTCFPKRNKDPQHGPGFTPIPWKAAVSTLPSLLAKRTESRKAKGNDVAVGQKWVQKMEPW